MYPDDMKDMINEQEYEREEIDSYKEYVKASKNYEMKIKRRAMITKIRLNDVIAKLDIVVNSREKESERIRQILTCSQEDLGEALYEMKKLGYTNHILLQRVENVDGKGITKLTFYFYKFDKKFDHDVKNVSEGSEHYGYLVLKDE